MSDWLTNFVGRGLGQENVQRIVDWDVDFAEPWAKAPHLWLILACAAAAVAALWYYLKGHARGRTGARVGLAVVRGLALVLLVLILAEPVLQITLVNRPRPAMWVLIDDTESMNIADDYSAEDRAQLNGAVGLVADDPQSKQKLTRADYVKRLLAKDDLDLLRKLEEKFRLQVFVFDRAEGVRPLEIHARGEDRLDAAHVAGQLTSSGQVTALGSVLADLAHRNQTTSLAGVVVISDFAQNAGPSAVGTQRAPAQRLGAPVYTVGVGATSAVDLGVSLSAPQLMKKAEREMLRVDVRQSGVPGRTVTVTLTAVPKDPGAGEPGPIRVGQREVVLNSAVTPVEFPFTPEEAGKFEFIAEVESLQEEIVTQNNRSVRDVNIRDDFLRLMFVEYEPTWEWRFIKEVFHRDKLVGMRGFRTFLRSADPEVRLSNPLFLTTSTPPRSEFFENDVIFLGDVPGEKLSPQFCDMVREFVSNFGGGLVVLAGPRFGPGELARAFDSAGRPLSDLLPVVVSEGSRLRDERPFRLQLTAQAEGEDFMRLGDDEAGGEHQRAWDNMGPLPWYQPVLRPHAMAQVLAQHPTDTCIDGETPQPIIAVRSFVKGEVVYVGMNETWRLRRRYGELYYRQFWGQMIHRLGLRHALGSQKRFVVFTDRQHYKADETVTLTVEAYDEDFKPLDENNDQIEDRRLEGEIYVPGPTADAPAERQPISLAQLRRGVFETRIPVYATGEHRIRVKDPITGEHTLATFQVSSVSAERRSAVRNVALEEEIARATNGRTYDLTTVASLPEEVQATSIEEIQVKNVPLWNTTPVFALLCALLLGEWLFRKLNNLS